MMEDKTQDHKDMQEVLWCYRHGIVKEHEAGESFDVFTKLRWRTCPTCKWPCNTKRVPFSEYVAAYIPDEYVDRRIVCTESQNRS